MNYLVSLDAEILEKIREFFSVPLIDLALKWVFAATFLGIFWIIAAFFFVFKKKKRYIFYGVIISLLMGFAAAYCLSFLPPRSAPQIGTSEIALMFSRFKVRFPSFSTVMAFSSVVILARHCRRLSALFIVAAFLVPLSHLYFMLCFPIDAIISIIAGLLSGNLAERIVLKLAPSGEKVK